MKRFRAGGSIDRFFEFSLLGLLTSAYLAIAGSGYLDAPTIIITAIGILVRGLMIQGVIRLDLSPRVVTAATLAYVGFYPLDYLFISQEFLTATVHLVFFLAIAKLLTARTGRDYLYLKILAMLMLLASSVLSGNLSFFVLLAFFLLFSVATLASSEIRRSTEQRCIVVQSGLTRFPQRLAMLSVVTVAGVLVITSVLFFLLPRTARAAFQHLVSERYHLAGFSNEVTLGQIGELRTRSTPVMHVRFDPAVTPPALKWRGTALSNFDGRRWYNPPHPGQPLIIERSGLLRLVDYNQQRRAGTRRFYEVHLKNIVSDTLFFGGTPEFLQIFFRDRPQTSPTVIRSSTDSFRIAFSGGEDIRYGVHSHFADESTPPPSVEPLNAASRSVYLALPVVDPRVASLAAQVSSGSSSDLTRARAIEMHLRSAYGYTIELPAEQRADPLAHFLFERRKGHCEYFASALAVMLRTQGIPSRVVTGFQSGVYNPLSGWRVIRASDAHSWVEAWLAGLGWTTFDPTPPDPSPASASLWARLQLYADAADMFWQDWVLNYDLDRQLILASHMDSSRRFGGRWFDVIRVSWSASFSEMGAWLKRHAWTIGTVVLTAASVVLAMFWFRIWLVQWLQLRRIRHGSGSSSDATTLYARLLGLLKRRGFEKPAWTTPDEFARLLPPSEMTSLVVEFTAAYNAMRFGGRREAARELMSLLDRLDRMPA